MVKVTKLWGNGRFSSLPPKSKLLYIYLVTHPSISTLGVLELNKHRINLDLSFEDKDLENNINFLKHFSFLETIEDSELEVFIIKDHFLSLSKSKLNIRKAMDEGKNSLYKKKLNQIYSSEDFKPSMGFIPPTPEEVSEYALTKGYIVNGKTFVDYYSSNDWYNKNNKKVRSWKRTLERVWFRDENKLTPVKGAPKGFEYFYTTLEDGTRLSPEGWKSGKPTHSNYLYAALLNDIFESKT